MKRRKQDTKWKNPTSNKKNKQTGKMGFGYSAEFYTWLKRLKSIVGRRGNHGNENKTPHFILISIVLSGTCFLSFFSSFFYDFKTNIMVTSGHCGF